MNFTMVKSCVLKLGERVVKRVIINLIASDVAILQDCHTRGKKARERFLYRTRTVPSPTTPIALLPTHLPLRRRRLRPKSFIH